MLKNNLHKILEIFFKNPLTKDFQLREISREINLAPKSVKIYLEELKNNKLILTTPHRIYKYPTYKANRDNPYFKLLKKLNTIKTIHECNLLNYLDEKCQPDVIILFGSAKKGEDVETSDIDLYVQSPKKKLNLNIYEKSLSRNINVFFEENFDKLSNELKTNIINGDVLKGYLKVNLENDRRNNKNNS